MARIRLELPEKFVFSTEIPVRISDINYGGHLGNDAVLALAHEARLRFLVAAGFSEMNIGGRGLILSDAAVVYKSEAFYGDLLRIEIALDDPNRYGCDLLYRLTQAEGGREVARAKTGIVFMDYEKRKVARMPDMFRSAFFAQADIAGD